MFGDKNYILRSESRVYNRNMEDNILKVIYTFFLGLLLALFVGMGISTFYPAPSEPESPVGIYETQPLDTKGVSEEQAAADRRYQEEWQTYNEKMQVYNRDVSIISLIISVLLLVVAFILERRNSILSNGLLLGGVFTLAYAIIRGIMSQNTQYRFIAITVALAIVIYLGYRRFGRHHAEKPVAKSVK